MYLRVPAGPVAEADGPVGAIPARREWCVWCKCDEEGMGRGPEGAAGAAGPKPARLYSLSSETAAL